MELRWVRFQCRLGSEWAPDSPFGVDVLTLDAAGRFQYENRTRGEVRRQSGPLAPRVLLDIDGWLDEAGFPAVPAHSIPPGSALVELAVEDTTGWRTVHLHHFSALKYPGYGDLIRSLNGWVSRLRDAGDPDR